MLCWFSKTVILSGLIRLVFSLMAFIPKMDKVGQERLL